MIHRLKVWWLSQKVDNAKREIAVLELDLATAAQNREVMLRRLTALEVELALANSPLYQKDW